LACPLPAKQSRHRTLIPAVLFSLAIMGGA
jgi:hypothetical protein